MITQFKSIMEEIWNDIEGFEGYQVSNLGRVRSIRMRTDAPTKPMWLSSKVLKQYPDGKGYLMAWLYKGGKRYTVKVHRLVANSFIPNPENKPQIDHIDGDKINNHVDNLRWVTAKENFHNPITYKCNAESKRGVLNHSARRVCQISTIGKLIRIWDCINDVERELGFCHSHIVQCCKGQRDYAYGYYWCYDD